MTVDIRWKQRFEHFDRALALLHEALEAIQREPRNNLYQIALIGSFKFTFELGWKTLKDYLQYEGVEVSLPREVIKQAFHYQLIKDGQCWIDMLEDRDLLAYGYDDIKAAQAVKSIQSTYRGAILQVHQLLREKLGQS